ncbi:MAG: NAD(P)/FAD-dependent oxidoreductase [Actinobacteria bacterium]|nr:NAD(P)/FAD-dependent oxidoreductase [Actinomycetota bacterium]
MDYDAVIIGAGLGGLAAGAALSGAGKKVLVLEKTGVVGGKCCTSMKNGFKMDHASHLLMRSAFGPFTDALKRVNKENDVKFYHLDDVMFKIRDQRFNFRVSTVLNFMNRLLPTTGLRIMLATSPLANKVISIFSRLFDRMTIQDVVKKWTDSVPFHNCVGWISFILFGGPYYETPFGEMLRTFTDVSALSKMILNEKCMIGYVKDGLISFPNALRDGIEERGGKVQLNTTVSKVLVKNGKVTGVQLEDGQVIDADLVISNTGIKETVKFLVGEEHFDKKYTEYCESLKPGCPAFALRLALDKPVFDYDLVMSIPMPSLEEYYHEMWDRNQVPKELCAIMATSPSNMDPRLAPKGQQSVIVIAPLARDRKTWAAYEKIAMDTIIDAVPEIKDHILWYDYLGPEFYEVHGEIGSPAIGLAQCMGQAGSTRPSSVSPIKGLYYAGAEAGRNVSGVATEIATHSGLNCADYILKMEKTPALVKRAKKMLGIKPSA